MVQVLINTLVLIGSMAIPLGMLFWKHFATRPGETIRAIITTIVSTLGLMLFFGYVTFLTLVPGEDFITFVKLVLNWF
jgi:hypothetical protein